MKYLIDFFVLVSITLFLVSCQGGTQLDKSNQQVYTEEQAGNAVDATMDAERMTTAPKTKKRALPDRDETPTDYNTEEYSSQTENPFLEVTKNPLSTFFD